MLWARVHRETSVADFACQDFFHLNRFARNKSGSRPLRDLVGGAKFTGASTDESYRVRLSRP